jgi:hypothetical protein
MWQFLDDHCWFCLVALVLLYWGIKDLILTIKYGDER